MPSIEIWGFPGAARRSGVSAEERLAVELKDRVELAVLAMEELGLTSRKSVSCHVVKEEAGRSLAPGWPIMVHIWILQKRGRDKALQDKVAQAVGVIVSAAAPGCPLKVMVHPFDRETRGYYEVK